MDNFEQIDNELITALRSLEKAAEIIQDLPEYNNQDAIFHNWFVNRYNRIVTAAQMINKAQ